MKFLSGLEVLRSIYLSLVFGAILALIYLTYESFLKVLKGIFSLPSDVIHLSRRISLKNLKSLSSCRFKRNENERVNNVSDAIIFFLFGVLTILYFYVALDGIFRIYALFFVITTFQILKKTVGRIITLAFETVFLFLYRTILLFVGCFVAPMYKSAVYLTKIIYKHTEPIRRKYLFKKSKKTESKKIAAINKLLEFKEKRSNDISLEKISR